jgi:predicted RNA binding protein YcfA (HicA-like mRNA interferase family)
LPKAPAVSPKKLVAALKRCGFYEVRQKGSHLRMERGNLQVTIPIHARDLNPVVLRSILRQAHLSIEDLNKAM